VRRSTGSVMVLLGLEEGEGSQTALGLLAVVVEVPVVPAVMLAGSENGEEEEEEEEAAEAEEEEEEPPKGSMAAPFDSLVFDDEGEDPDKKGPKIDFILEGMFSINWLGCECC